MDNSQRLEASQELRALQGPLQEEFQLPAGNRARQWLWEGQARPGWCLWASPTLLELAEADGAGLIPVILLEEASPLLDEAEQGGEAVDVDAPRPRFVNMSGQESRAGRSGKAAEASRELRIRATAPRNPALIPKSPPHQDCDRLAPFNPRGW